MKTVTMLELRKNAGKIIRWSRMGQSMTVTYRGKPVMKIEPIITEKASQNDPFYNIGDFADNSTGSMTNEDMDKLIYEP